MQRDAIQELAQAVRDGLPGLRLTYLALAEERIADLDQVDDPKRTERGLRWLAGLGTDTTSSALGSALASVAMQR